MRKIVPVMLLIMSLIFFTCSKQECGNCNINNFQVGETVKLKSNSKKVYIRGKENKFGCCSYYIYYMENGIYTYSEVGAEEVEK